MNISSSVATRGQRMAERAFKCVNKFSGDKKEYSSCAKRFPSLIHSCGLAQALAFAQAKAPEVFLRDLATVLGLDKDRLLNDARESAVSGYLRLSREALEAAGWLKRYAEALLEEDDETGGSDASM